MGVINQLTLTILILVLAASLLAEAVESGIDQIDDIELNITPYPYNTDIDGNDLPVEMGRFTVPAQRGSTADASKIELGFVRYVATEGASGPPIVFLTENSAPREERQALYSRLREVGDVIVFNRRGFGLSSALPPCPGRINYPLDEELERTLLNDLTQAFVAECIDSIEGAGIFPEYFSSREVALDLNDLARALDASTLALVAENNMTVIALAAIEHIPSILDRVVLVNPQRTGNLKEGDFVSLLMRRDADRATPLNQSVMRQFRTVSTNLAIDPVFVTVATQSDRYVDLQIGDFDLALIAARLLGSGASGLQSLSSLLAQTIEGHTAKLGVEALRTREWLAAPDPAVILSGTANPSGNLQDEQSNLAYALNWPVSALVKKAEPSGYTQLNGVSSRAPDILIVGGLQHVGISPESIRAVSARFDNIQVIGARCSNTNPLDENPSTPNLLIEFLSGQLAINQVELSNGC